MGIKRTNKRHHKISHNTFKRKITSLVDTGRLHEALLTVNTELKEHPNSIPLLELNELLLFSLDRYDEALRVCDKIMEIDPIHTKILVQKSEVLYRMGQHKEGLNTINMAIEYGHNNLEAQAIKAELLSVLKRFDEALALSKQLLKRNPHNLKVQELHANILSLSGRHAESAIQLENLILASTRSAPRVLELVAEYILAKNFTRALMVVDTILDVAPENHMILTLKAEILFGLGKLDDALNYIQMSHSKDTAYAETWYQKARILAKTDFDGSFDALRVAISLNPANAQRAQTEELFSFFRTNDRFRIMVGLK